MKITRKLRPGTDVPEQPDNHTSSPSIVRLGTIAELVEGGGSVHADGHEMSLFGWNR